MGLLSLAVGIGALAAAAVLFAAAIRLPTAVDALMTAYLLASALSIVVALALSPGDWLTRSGLLIASAVVLVVAIAVWWRTGRPGLPFARQARSAWIALRDPPVCLLALGVAAALVYSAVLSIATAPNDYDSLWYHLARPAFWAQGHAVGYVANANDQRLDIFPPGAEITAAWPMVLEGSERFASLFQLVGLAATLVALAGIGRRLGLTARAALFGALVFASLPVVALQAGTALNDIAVTSFLVVSVWFLLSPARPWPLLGALALALAVTTKTTALLALPLLLVIAAAVRPRRDWARIALAGVGALAVGGLWYGVNLVEKGHLLSGYTQDDSPNSRAGYAVRMLGELSRTVVDTVDPAGEVGRDRLVYVLAAVALAVAGAVVAARRRVAVAAALCVAAALVLIPVATATAHEQLLRGYQHVWLRLDEPVVAFIAFDRDPRVPSPIRSWYGPLGVLLFVAAVPLVARAVRRREIPRGAWVFLLAPVGYLVIVVLAIDYGVDHGRYLMPAVAVSAATWGLAVEVRALAWTACATALATLLLVFVHYEEKPAGIALLERPARESVWSAPRSAVLAAAHVRGPFAVVGSLTRPGVTIALRLRQDDVTYPYFGSKLDRRIILAPDGDDRPLADAGWLVVAPGLSTPSCKAAWTAVSSEAGGWRVYRRSGRCP